VEDIIIKEVRYVETGMKNLERISSITERWLAKYLDYMFAVF
jgi:hypothetical protein